MIGQSKSACGCPCQGDSPLTFCTNRNIPLPSCCSSISVPGTCRKRSPPVCFPAETADATAAGLPETRFAFLERNARY